jgi:hypothetical protein
LLDIFEKIIKDITVHDNRRRREDLATTAILDFAFQICTDVFSVRLIG